MKLLRIFLSIFCATLILIFITSTGLYLSANMGEPDLKIDTAACHMIIHENYRECNGSYLRQSESGLWELMLTGSDTDRGSAFGKLAKDLLYYQESVFINQIRNLIPSDAYLGFLRYLTVIFNRNLGVYIPQEYRNEIYAMSQFCTDEYNAIGTPYARQLNYHAAHDIGHAMQSYMLVGCTAFGVKNSKSMDSTLLIGRNFDFYVGDDFSKNKIVMFVDPDKGHRFASIGWAGMIGVLSGMNDQGLTITLNAAKGDMPVSSALPVSLLAREILQYAATIDQAYEIARKRNIFVSESFLISSALDNRTVVIEKTPNETALFESDDDQIICTNHYQSELFENDPQNQENISQSDSPYRFERVEQLLSQYDRLDPLHAALLLRDRYGLDNKDIGIANEKLINQSIAHHSVIFKPAQRLMWVSTTQWQSGKYVCYDLNRIFDGKPFSAELYTDELTIAADSVFLVNDYPRVLRYRELCKVVKQSMKNKQDVLSSDLLDELIRSNPEHYYGYKLTGDYYAAKGLSDQARVYWTQALKKEIPQQYERNELEILIND